MAAALSTFGADAALFVLEAEPRRVSVHCSVPEDGVVFAYLIVDTNDSIEEFIFRRSWGQTYCDVMRTRLESLIEKSARVRIVGEARAAAETIRRTVGERGIFGKRAFFSIFDSATSETGECLGYFDHSCGRP